MPKLKITVLRMGEEDNHYECDRAIFPGVDGQVGVMYDHTRFATPLRSGNIRIKNDVSDEFVEIDGGFLIINKEGAKVLLG